MHTIVRDIDCLLRTAAEWPELKVVALDDTEQKCFSFNFAGDSLADFDPAAAELAGGSRPEFAICPTKTQGEVELSNPAAIFATKCGWMIAWDSGRDGKTLTRSIGVDGHELFLAYLRMLIRLRTGLDSYLQLTSHQMTEHGLCKSAGFLRIFGPSLKDDCLATIDFSEPATKLQMSVVIRDHSARLSDQAARLVAVLCQEPLLSIEYAPETQNASRC